MTDGDGNDNEEDDTKVPLNELIMLEDLDTIWEYL